MDAVGHLHLGADVPPGAIQQHQDLLALARTDRLGEFGQRQAKQVGPDRGQQEPPRLARAGADEAIEIGPLLARLHPHDHPLPAPRPDRPQDRLEPHPVLVAAPQLDLVGGMRLPHRRYGCCELPPVNASCPAPSALACRGRGRCGVKPSRRT